MYLQLEAQRWNRERQIPLPITSGKLKRSENKSIKTSKKSNTT